MQNFLSWQFAFLTILYEGQRLEGIASGYWTLSFK